jgi:hypothetical protein
VAPVLPELPVLPVAPGGPAGPAQALNANTISDATIKIGPFMMIPFSRFDATRPHRGSATSEVNSGHYASK